MRFAGLSKNPPSQAGFLFAADLIDRRIERLIVAHERFPAKWMPVRVQKTRKIVTPETFFDPIGSENALAHAETTPCNTGNRTPRTIRAKR